MVAISFKQIRPLNFLKIGIRERVVFFWQNNCLSLNMKFSLIAILIFSLAFTRNPAQSQSLIGNWQLVHFDGMEKVRNSPQYREADATMKANMEAKINYRLESTVYQFISADSLYFTDFVNQIIVRKKAKIEVSSDNVLSINDGDQIKKAKILELEPDRLVIEPIVQGGNVGKFVFERIIEAKKD